MISPSLERSYSCHITASVKHTAHQQATVSLCCHYYLADAASLMHKNLPTPVRTNYHPERPL